MDVILANRAWQRHMDDMLAQRKPTKKTMVQKKRDDAPPNDSEN